MKNFDVAIIGAGPVGLFSASFAHLHGLKTITFDSLKEAGGQPKALYPFKTVYDIPAFTAITGKELVAQLQEGIAGKSTLALNHRVKTVVKESNGFVIDDEFHVKSVILATGAGSFTPKKLPLKLDAECEKRVHYLIKEPAKYANQKIAVLGGGDSALDWALELAAQPNTQVKVIHRRNEFRGLETSAYKLKSLKNVEVLTPYLPKSMAISDNQLNVELKQVGSTDTINQQIDQVIVAYGFRANNRFVQNWGIELANGQVNVAPEMKTNVDGIYAVGDAVGYTGRVPVIGLGFGEAQIAVTSIMRTLFPEKNLTIHSTSI